MSSLTFTNVQMLVMGPARWPKEEQARAFFTINHNEHLTKTRKWPFPYFAMDHLTVEPGWERTHHYSPIC
jgi:hypothetical protein